CHQILWYGVDSTTARVLDIQETCSWLVVDLPCDSCGGLSVLPRGHPLLIWAWSPARCCSVRHRIEIGFRKLSDHEKLREFCVHRRMYCDCIVLFPAALVSGG